MVTYVESGLDPRGASCGSVTRLVRCAGLRDTPPEVKATCNVGQFETDDAIKRLDKRHNCFEPFEDGGSLLNAKHQTHLFSTSCRFDRRNCQRVIGSNFVSDVGDVGDEIVVAAVRTVWERLHARHMVLLSQELGCSQRVAQQILKIHFHDLLEVSPILEESLMVVGFDMAPYNIRVRRRALFLLSLLLLSLVLLVTAAQVRARRG